MIQIPSRERSENMERIFSLLPDAHVFVEESEIETYEPVVPEGHLHSHPMVENVPAKRNWMLDNFHDKFDCIVQCDDDFEGFWRLVGKKQRLITDPDAIRGAIENLMYVCNDLHLGVFCWSRTRKQLKFQNSTLNPFHFKTPMMGMFGLLNKALHTRRFDESLVGRADLDFTLNTLLMDRILLADMRLYGEFGPMRSASKLRAETVERVHGIVAKRWARSLKFKSNSYKFRKLKGKNASTPSFEFDIRRQQ